MIDVWRLFYGARPFSSNDRLHHHAHNRLVEEWKGAFCMLAREARIPKGLDHITITVVQHYTDERYEPDHDNCAPAVKAATDGLVLAGVVQDDKKRWVGPTTYHLPVLGKQIGLELLVFNEPAPELIAL